MSDLFQGASLPSSLKNLKLFINGDITIDSAWSLEKYCSENPCLPASGSYLEFTQPNHPGIDSMLVLSKTKVSSPQEEKDQDKILFFFQTKRFQYSVGNKMKASVKSSHELVNRLQQLKVISYWNFSFVSCLLPLIDLLIYN